MADGDDHTISVSESVKRELDQRGTAGESYSDVLLGLLGDTDQDPEAVSPGEPLATRPDSSADDAIKLGHGYGDPGSPDGGPFEELSGEELEEWAEKFRDDSSE